LLIKIKRRNLNEKDTLLKWQQLIQEYQESGIDVIDCSALVLPEKNNIDEIWFALKHGEKTQSHDHKEIYALIGEFIRFLYETMSYIGSLNISLERKSVVFQIQTEIP
jgi:predicted RNA-binding protein Jag